VEQITILKINDLETLEKIIRLAGQISEEESNPHIKIEALRVIMIATCLHCLYSGYHE